MVFPAHLEKPTMAFVGCIQPIGAVMPVSEIQARWATRVFQGLAKLPSMAEMKEEINKRKEDMQSRYVKSERHTIQVDYVPYMDEVAVEVGCKPDIKQFLLSDPKLAWEIFFGPCTPYQYRICGPGQWKDARKTILTQKDRIIKPTKTRIMHSEMAHSSFNMLAKFLGILVIFAAIYVLM
ncbi:unnamed protein product [Staurois parvus]|uniref:Flavin-containing monooxygenase n=1 Tax=Staurois parvus TaxID=386267 RepID=A0ABN9D3W5_9NEOB|nr:unnamed protein product [Staurois parvus]